MNPKTILHIALSSKYICLTIFGFTLLTLGKMTVLVNIKKAIFITISNDKHPTSKIPYFYISFFGKELYIGRSVFWEPKVFNTVLKVIDFTSSYKYDKDGIKFTYYKGTKTTTYEEAYDTKGNTVKTEWVWIHDSDKSLVPIMRSLEHFPMYNTAGEFQHPHVLVSMFKEIHKNKTQ